MLMNFKQIEAVCCLTAPIILINRLASHHSRAANNAFLRGDHFSAQQLSLKAREEWLAAEKLNAEAAKEILLIRNEKNDVWKLDLHGLHASEAVRALEEHLHIIETQIPIKRYVSSDGVDTPQMEIVHSPSVKSSCTFYMEAKTRKQEALSTDRQTILHVITGRELLCSITTDFCSKDATRYVY